MTVADLVWSTVPPTAPRPCSGCATAWTSSARASIRASGSCGTAGFQHGPPSTVVHADKACGAHQLADPLAVRAQLVASISCDRLDLEGAAGSQELLVVAHDPGGQLRALPLVRARAVQTEHSYLVTGSEEESDSQESSSPQRFSNRRPHRRGMPGGEA